MGINTSCWEFTGARVNGYGQVSVGGRRDYTHRLAYEALIGPIPSGMQIDHLCRNRACYNPAHLEPVTAQENLHRAFVSRGFTPKQHGLNGYRNRHCRCEVCRAANRAYQRQYRERRAA